MYYLNNIKIANDGTVTKEILAYENEKSAKSAFHSKKADNEGNKDLKTWTDVILDDVGSQIKRAYYGDASTNDAYFVVAMQEDNEGGHPCSISDPYTDKASALVAMDTELASNYASPALKSFACVVLNKIGGKVDGDGYKEPEPAPEPEPNAEA